MTTESSICKYMCTTTNQPDAKSNPSPNSNRTTKLHAVVIIQLKVVTVYGEFHTIKRRFTLRKYCYCFTQTYYIVANSKHCCKLKI